MQRCTFLQSLAGGFGKRSQGTTAKKSLLLQESPLAGFPYHRAHGVWPFLREGEPLRLMREPHNPHDPNAIAVYFHNDRLGYVPRQGNAPLAAIMDRGKALEARITRLLETDNPWRRVRFSIYLRS